MPDATYAELLRQTQPAIIRNDREHRRVLKLIEKLMQTTRLSAAEGKLLDLLSRLADDYEETVYPTPNVSPQAMLEHLLAERGASRAELARATGIARSTISEVLKGKRAISVENAFRLGEYFHADASLFLVRETS